MINKILNGGVIVLCLIALIGCVFLACNAPKRERSPQDQQFVAFANSYVTAYDAHRLAKFDREVKGEYVEWEGMVTDVSPTGENLNIIPFAGPTWGNGHTRMQAFICLKEGTELLPMIQQYSRVRVKGRIHSVSVLSTIIEATSVSCIK